MSSEGQQATAANDEFIFLGRNSREVAVNFSVPFAIGGLFVGSIWLLMSLPSRSLITDRYGIVPDDAKEQVAVIERHLNRSSETQVELRECACMVDGEVPGASGRPLRMTAWRVWYQEDGKERKRIVSLSHSGMEFLVIDSQLED